MTRISLIIISLFSITIALGQQPTPAPKQTKTISFKGGTIHVGNGTIVSNGEIVFKDGKIIYVGNIQNENQETEVINCAGKEIYPGFIAPNSTLGLTEIEAVRATMIFMKWGKTMLARVL